MYALLACLPAVAPIPSQAPRPNVVLVMADDLGYGDVGFVDGDVRDTPELDRLAQEGVILSHFYAAAPVCSPTRASFLTGRHPTRMGITGANEGHLPHAEITLAECLREAGYKTGFFGKWHLGTLTRKVPDSNRGGKEKHLAHYSPPQEHGFQTVFATEAKVPTYDPMVNPNTGEPYGTRYWDENGAWVQDNLAGDDSALILDRTLAFIDSEAQEPRPFLAVVWLHAPHLPVVASPAARERYKDRSPGAQAYFGSIHDLDAQMGRLREHLRSRGLAENTLVAFCSDNGPEGPSGTEENGSTAGLRGRKRSLYEGGVRVPAFVTWPAGLPAGTHCEVPAVTSDWMATVLEACGEARRLPARPSDGISLLGALRGKPAERHAPIGFRYRKQRSLVDGHHKWIQTGERDPELYDLAADPGEQSDLAGAQAEMTRAMGAAYRAWEASCARSSEGVEYGPCEALIPVSRPTAKHPAAGWTEGTDWLDQHQQCRRIGSRRGVRVVLFGDSITQGFGDPDRSIRGAGRAVFDEMLAPLGAANFGISGDRTQHVLWRLEQGALDGLDPDWIVLNIGTNNVRHDGPGDIAAGIRAILDSLGRRAPRAQVLLLGVFPRGADAAHPERIRVNEINGLLGPLAARYGNVHYRDLGGLFLLPDGRAHPGRMAKDHIHLQAPGYRAWAEALATVLLSKS